MTSSKIKAIEKFSTALCVLLISAVVAIFFAPGLRIGFLWDDWSFITLLVKLDLGEYLRFFFDPRVQFIWYRPMFGVMWLAEYTLFGADPFGFHVVWMLLHLLNGLLLFALVRRLSHHPWLALLSALFFVTLPTISWVAMWPIEPQNEATAFALAATWFWIAYLERARARDYLRALLFYCLALMTKETSIVLPAVLLGIEIILLRRPFRVFDLFRRYALFGFAGLTLIAFDLRSITYGVSTRQVGYSAGSHLAPNLIKYLTELVVPWSINPVADQILALGIYAFAGWSAWRKKNRALVFLGLVALVTLLPVIPFPKPQSRYLYAPALAFAIAAAMLVVWLAQNRRRVAVWSIGLLVALFLIGNGLRIDEAAALYASMSLDERAVFRAIRQRHPTFPPGTYIYFINTYIDSLEGMFLGRYGKTIAVGSVQSHVSPDLRAHPHPLIIYLDEQERPIEIPVAPTFDARAAPPLPVNFNAAIQLARFDLASARVQPGEYLAAIFYLQSLENTDRDYTIFVHLVDAAGNQIAGADAQMATRSLRASDQWKHGAVLPIDANTPPGNYAIRVGFYDRATGERLPMVDANGQSFGDAVTIETIYVGK
ncbi:MAG: glycosyltransferase family 39 protein [Chloroflexi bacterium]|nr:glycosyltransferase family 39 protein [Chloroflexota bacterium]